MSFTVNHHPCRLGRQFIVEDVKTIELPCSRRAFRWDLFPTFVVVGAFRSPVQCRPRVVMAVSENMLRI